MSDSTERHLHGDGDTVTIADEPVHRPSPFNEGPSVGSALGRYVVLDTLGSGGMGIVVRAYDPRLRREVAVKRLRSGTRGDQKELMREAQAMAQLSHPNVVAVHDVEPTAEGTIIAMELAPGVTLREWWSTPRTWPEVVEVFVEAGRGLQAAHAVGLVHRDFKPDNVLVGEDGRVRVTDFGLAGVSDLTDETVNSGDSFLPELSRRGGSSGLIFGTPAYMAPEQHASVKTSTRTDQYAFCLALWEGLCGARPFEGANLQQLYKHKLAGPPPWPTEVEVPPWLASLVRRGLEVDPDQRWTSMATLLEVLVDWPERRRRRQRWLGAAGMALLASGAGLAYWNALEPPCMQGQARVAEVWGDEHRERVEDRFDSSDRVYATSTLPIVTGALDGYAREWARVHDDACMAHADQEQSSHVLDLRMLCLDRRRASLGTVVELLTDPEADVVARAPQMMDELPRLDRCADVESLLAQAPHPEDPTVAAEVEALGQQLAELHALFSAGLYARLDERLDPLHRRAEDTGFAPVIAEFEIVRALSSTAAGRYLDTEAHYRRAYALALGVDDDEVAAKAAVGLVFILGSRMARYDEAMTWSDTAMVLAERIEPQGRLHAHALGHLGSLLVLMGRLDDAEAPLRASLAIQREREGGLSLPVATAETNLATLIDAKGDMDETVRLLEHAVTIDAERLGAEHPTTLAAKGNLASALLRMGDVDGCRRISEELLSVHRREPEPSSALARVLVNVAALEVYSGQFESARSMCREAIDILGQRLGPQHPELTSALTTMGAIHIETGEYERARQVFQRIIDIRVRSFGPGHPDVARAKEELGSAMLHLGRYDEAESLQRNAVASLERRLGPDHPDVVRMVNNLASLLMARDRPAEAEPLFRRAMSSWEAQRGPEDPDMVMALSNLGSALEAQGRLDEAAEYLATALSIRERTLGPRHPRLAYTLGSLGVVRLAQGDLDRAEQLQRRALEIRREALGADHPQVATPLRGLAEVQRVRGQLEDAEQSLREAIALLERSVGPEHPSLAETSVELAEVLLEHDKAPDAVVLLERTVASPSAESSPVILASARFALARAVGTSDRARAGALATQAREAFASHGHDERERDVARWLSEASFESSQQ